MIIEAVLENQIIAALSEIEGAEEYQIVGSRTIPEEGETKSEDENSVGVIAVSVGYRSNDNFSLPTLTIPVTLQVCTRTEEDATGTIHERLVSSISSKLSFWHLHGDMMTARFSSQKFLAGELTLAGGSGRKCDDATKCWSENISFSIRGSERFTDDEYKYDIDWSKVNNPPSLNGVTLSSDTSLDDIDVYSKEEVNQIVYDAKDDIESVIPTKTSQLSNDSGFLSAHQSLSGYATEKWVESKNYLTEHQSLSNITNLIPVQATTENQLADKAFVNSSINNYAAFYLTKNANGDAFGTYAELTSATKFWNAGVEKTPTKNDYLVVLEDETKTTALGVDPTTRYTYQGEWPTGQFEFQYIVNNTALTQAQVDAINSGITKSIVDSRVIPSTTNPGYAKDAEYALQASASEWATNAGYAESAGYASYAESANNANNAETANTAISATYAPNYTPLSTFNETLGDLSSIIHEI